MALAKTPAKAAKPVVKTTGVTGTAGFAWSRLPGRAPAASRLSWVSRQNDANTEYNRAKNQRTTDRQAATTDYKLDSANRGYAYSQDATSSALEAAGGGVGSNGAIAGRALRGMRTSWLNDKALVDTAYQRRLGMADQMLTDAQQARLDMNSQILLEMGKTADPSYLMNVKRS